MRGAGEVDSNSFAITRTKRDSAGEGTGSSRIEGDGYFLAISTLGIILQDGGGIDAELITPRCNRGCDVALQICAFYSEGLCG